MNPPPMATRAVREDPGQLPAARRGVPVQAVLDQPDAHWDPDVRMPRGQQRRRRADGDHVLPGPETVVFGV